MKHELKPGTVVVHLDERDEALMRVLFERAHDGAVNERADGPTRARTPADARQRARGIVHRSQLGVAGTCSSCDAPFGKYHRKGCTA